MKVVVGLGNPGERYASTRHNVGFWLVKAWNRAHDFSGPKSQCHGRIWSGMVGDIAVKSVLPSTFMNASGESVQAVLRFYRRTPCDLIVVYDDFELPFGAVRIREKGTAGTHNGMRSIIQSLGNQTFVRMRIGVGPKPAHMDAANYVLGRFSTEEQTGLTERKKNWIEQLNNLVQDQVQQAQMGGL